MSMCECEKYTPVKVNLTNGTPVFTCSDKILCTYRSFILFTLDNKKRVSSTSAASRKIRSRMKTASCNVAPTGGKSWTAVTSFENIFSRYFPSPRIAYNTSRYHSSWVLHFLPLLKNLSSVNEDMSSTYLLVLN